LDKAERHAGVKTLRKVPEMERLMPRTTNVPRCVVHVDRIVTAVAGVAGGFAFPTYDAVCGFAGVWFGVDA
jgi:hypothetical protein